MRSIKPSPAQLNNKGRLIKKSERTSIINNRLLTMLYEEKDLTSFIDGEEEEPKDDEAEDETEGKEEEEEEW